jgi:hypothetical protein
LPAASFVPEKYRLAALTSSSGKRRPYSTSSLARGIVGGAADPWWLYPLGLDANPERRLDALRAEVRR